MNLEHPWYLLIPVISAIAVFFLKKTALVKTDLSKFADAHLLKYLINIPKRQNLYKYISMFGIIFLLSLALANPRWGQREYTLYSGNSAAVIVLDVSSHMSCQDVRPTRSIRSRQISAEIVKSFQNVNFGLLAFAKNPHLISPITEDQATLNNYLPAIDYRLVHQQGQELDDSLALASSLLDEEKTKDKSIILLSSGNFNLANYKSRYPVYVIGIGTEQGAPMHDSEDNHIYLNHQLQITKLNVENLKKVAAMSGGKYFSYVDVQRNVNILKKFIVKDKTQHSSENTVKTWNDGYAYILMIAAALIVFSLKRGVIILSLSVVMLLPINKSEAIELSSLFKNGNQRGKEAVERLDFTAAAESFDDPYNKGVSFFRAKIYDKAIIEFKKNKRSEVKVDALYNIGNSYYMLEHYKEAIDAYEQVLAIDPNHLNAKFNLELAKKKIKEEDKKDNDKNKKDDKDCGCDDPKEGGKSDSDKKDNNKDKKKDDNKPEPQEDQEQEQKQENSDNKEKKDDSNKDDSNKDDNQELSEDSQEAKDKSDNAKQDEVAYDEQQQKWLSRINSDISNFLKTRMYIDDIKSNK